MPNRRTGTIAALLMTAALFLAMPGLLTQALTDDGNRMAHSLRPARLRTVTVWLLPDGPEDRRQLNALCAQFEKQNKGARIFLRRVTADELYSENAVVPDVVLFSTGEINRPEDVLLPLAELDAHPSTHCRLIPYASALWYAPVQLCYPQSWGEDPWTMLTRPGAMEQPEGTALLQLLASCPPEKRSAVRDALLSPATAATAVPPGHDLPRSQGQTPTPAPTVAQPARMASAPKENEAVLPMAIDTNDRVRYAALCRDGEDARAFLAFLAASEPEGFTRVQPSAVLPNAFAHTRQEIAQLCLDAFRQLSDPALMLLRLR